MCVDTVIDDEDELINTKELSPRLRPNLPEQVGAVSQQAPAEEREEAGRRMKSSAGRGLIGRSRSIS